MSYEKKVVDVFNLVSKRLPEDRALELLSSALEVSGDEIKSWVKEAPEGTGWTPPAPKTPPWDKTVGDVKPMKAKPQDPNLPKIASLWIGDRLSWMEQLSLKSFVDYGHDVTLYVNNLDIKGVPEGVSVKSNAEVMGSADVHTHKNTDSPALYSDLFRYHMIKQTGAVWVDADMVCLRPWDDFEDGFAVGWEKPEKLVCGAALGLPPDSKTLHALLEFCEDEYPIPPWISKEDQAELIKKKEDGSPVHVTDMKWGVWGPSALTHFLRVTGELEKARERHVFYPVDYPDRRDLLKTRWKFRKAINETIGRDGAGMHLWNRRLSRRLVSDENGLPPEGSWLGQALMRHDIDPRDAPIPDRPPVGFMTIQEGLACERAKEETRPDSGMSA